MTSLRGPCGGCLLLIGWTLASVCAQSSERRRPYSFGDLDRDIKAFYAAFEQAGDADDAEGPAQLSDAVTNLCQTYHYLAAHPQFVRSDVLRGMRGRVRHHLREIEQALQRDAGAEHASASPTPATESSGGGLAGGLAGDRSVEWTSPGERSIVADQALSTATAINGSLLLQLTGGPDQWTAYAGNFGGTQNAIDLIQLIQSTIAPFHWDVNDGPGHIHYYSPQGLLVIRAGSEQHGEVSDLLQQLRDQR